MPVWAHANCASNAAEPTATAAAYSCSACKAAARSAGSGLSRISAPPATRSASPLPRQSTSVKSGGSGEGLWAGTQRARSPPPLAAAQSMAHKSACFPSGGLSRPGKRPMAPATYWESVTTRRRQRAAVAAVTAAYSSARCTDCAPGTGPAWDLPPFTKVGRPRCPRQPARGNFGACPICPSCFPLFRGQSQRRKCGQPDPTFRKCSSGTEGAGWAQQRMKRERP